MIQWIQEEVESDNLASNVSLANELLHTYFKVTVSESHCSFVDFTTLKKL